MLNRIKDRVTHAENTMQILKWASYMSDPYLFFSKFEMNFGAHIAIEQNWNIAYQVVYYSTPKVWLLSLLADCQTFPDFKLWGNISHWLLLHFQECFWHQQIAKETWTSFDECGVPEMASQHPS